MEQGYIAPELIGRIELTQSEKQKLKNVLYPRPTLQYLCEIICLFFLLIVFILYKILMKHETIFTLLIYIVDAVSCLILLLAFVPSNSDTDITFQTSAHGKVVKKEVFYKEVPIKSDPKLMPYYAESESTENKSVPFCYVTVKLDSGAYVRYVNCLREDFHALKLNDTILVVYFGKEKLIGVKL